MTTHDRKTTSPNAPSDPRNPARKAMRMMMVTVTAAVLMVAAFVLFVPAQFLDLRMSVLLKLGAGVLATIVLAAGLMAASFYSDESGHDDDAPGA